MVAAIQAAVEATTAFSATNVDDLFLLMLLFSRQDHALRPWPVVVGQYVGITALVAVSLLSLLGRFGLPEGWLGLLGLFPISLGLSQLAESFDVQAATPTASPSPAASITPPPSDPARQGGWAAIVAVAALTIANGSDNISVYMALLANGDGLRLRVFPLVFTLLTGLRCLLAWWLSQTPALASPLRRFARDGAPLLLMAIGALVLWDSHLPRHPALAVLALACLAVMVASLIQQLLRLRSRTVPGACQP